MLELVSRQYLKVRKEKMGFDRVDLLCHSI